MGKPFIIKENKDLYHVLYAEETKSEQFENQKKAKEFIRKLNKMAGF